MPTQTSITIDLKNLQKRLKSHELIQQGVYQAIRAQVEARLVEIKNHDASAEASAGWVSFIDGTRGAGKSTFLNTTLQLFKEEDGFKKLAVLPVIDPSRVEASEILLLTFIRELKQLVELQPHSATSTQSQRDLEAQWRSAFKDVAGGLALFQRNHHPLNELDADLFLDLGLERAGHSALLRLRLTTLVERTCQILGKEALLLGFDDADTDATHAIHMLEMIRKYLDTPRVLIMVTGDMELYSLLVRDYFHASLSRRSGQSWGQGAMSSAQQRQLTRMQDHLEEQYLLKLFPVGNRHRLRPLWDLISTDDTNENSQGFRLAGLKNWGGDALLPHVKSLVKKGFRLNASGDVQHYAEFLLKQPLRSVLQVLAKTADGDAVPTHFAPAVLGIGLSSLYRFDVDTDGLANDNLPALTEGVLTVALEDGDPETSAYLRPTSSKEQNKMAMFAMAATVPQQLEGRPADCLTYLFRGPGMVKLFSLIAPQSDNSVNDARLLEQYRRYMGVGRDDDALAWARLASVAIALPFTVNPRARVVNKGVIALNQRVRRKQGFKSFEAVIRSLEHYPAHVFTLMQASGIHTDVAPLASIYNLLGVMGRLLQIAQQNGWYSKDEYGQKEDIARVLNGCYPNLISVSPPPWLKTDRVDESTGDDDKAGESVQSAVSDDSRITAWIDKLHPWLIDLQKSNAFAKVYPSSVFLGKLWPRLYFGLENISESIRPKASQEQQEAGGFAALMELYALCVVNAFLMEESAHHLPSLHGAFGEAVFTPLNLNNPRSSASFYIENLSNVLPTVGRQVDRLPMTQIVSSCPLILGLIREEFAEKLKESSLFKLNGGGMNGVKQLFMSREDFADLNSVLIQGTQSSKSNSSASKKAVGKEATAPAAEG